MESKKLIDELTEITDRNLRQAESFKELPLEKLNFKKDKNSWSILECIEHLNRYGEFYIPEIEKRLNSSKHEKSKSFRSGLLGGYFAKSMLPNENMKKIRTFKSMDPIGSKLDKSVLDKFVAHQKELLGILERSRNTDLTKVKTSISITSFIKLRLGDTLRVLIYHNLRHIVQAKNVLS